MKKVINGVASLSNHFSSNPLDTIKEIPDLASLPELHTLHMSFQELEEHWPVATAAIAKLPDLEILDMSGANVGEYGPKTADELATAPKLCTLDMSFNNLGKNGPNTAVNLAQSTSLSFVKMQNNNLSNEQAIEIAKCFAYKDHPIKLGIDKQFHQPVLAAIEHDNDQMHVAFEEAMTDTFGKPTLGRKIWIAKSY